MQLNQLKPIHKRKADKRIGHGGVHGSHSGKGTKGQKCRTGKQFQPIVRELLKRYPKLRGYQFKAEKKYVILDFSDLDKVFENKGIINLKTLSQRKIISKVGKKLPEVKILGNGELTKAFVFEGLEISKSAAEKIKKAGGLIK